MNIQQKTEQIVSKLRGTDDYNFISSNGKMNACIVV